MGGNTNQNRSPKVSSRVSGAARMPNTLSHLFAFFLLLSFLYPIFSFQQSYLPTFCHKHPSFMGTTRPYTPTLSRGDLPLLPSTRSSSPSLRMA